MPVPPGLNGLDRAVGMLFALAAAIALLWVVERRQRAVPAKDFKQARNVALVATAVCIALLFTFLTSPERLALLGLIALATTVCSIVFFLWNVSLRVQMDQRGSRQMIGYLLSFILYVVCGCVALSAAGLLLYSVETNPLNRADDQPYDVAVTLAGTRGTSSGTQSLAFRVTSPTVRVGCGQTRPTTVAWDLPLAASIEGSPKAEWLNVSNALEPQATAEIERRRVVAHGTITGLPFERIRLPVGGSLRNCRGAASGELVLSGHYLPRVSGAQPYHAEMQGQLFRASASARALALTLPGEGVRVETATIALTAAGQLVDAVSLALVDGTVRETQSGKQIFTASADGRLLIVTLRNESR